MIQAMLILAVLVAMIMEHIVMGILDREAARELALEMEAYRRQAEQLTPPILPTLEHLPLE